MAASMDFRMQSAHLDYDSQADNFDANRSLSLEKEQIWIECFKNNLALVDTSRVLDVGCGTGRFAVAIHHHLGSLLTGVDPSIGMLNKAKAKCANHILWVQGFAETLPVAEDSFDACLVSQVVHHFRDKSHAFGEIYRVLRPKGKLGIRYSSHDQLRLLPDYRFFPSALAKDLERVPDTPELKALLNHAGFSALKEYQVSQPFYNSTEDYLIKLKERYASVLSMITEAEYQSGLSHAIAYFGKGRIKDEERIVPMTFLVAVK